MAGLDGKVAIVTLGGSGLGEAIGKRLRPGEEGGPPDIDIAVCRRRDRKGNCCAVSDGATPSRLGAHADRCAHPSLEQTSHLAA